MEIRPLRREQLGAISKVFVGAYPEGGWTDDSARVYLERFHAIEPQSCMVAVEDNKLVGAILGYSYQKQDSLVLFIQELFVDPDYRHRGFGKALVTALRNSFAEMPRVKVTPLVKAETRVLNFYNSLGFEGDQAIAFLDIED